MKSIYTVVLNFNGSRDTVECLASLAQLHCRGFNHNIVVVDNASEASEIEYLRSKLPAEIHYVQSLTNTGYAEGNNIGIRIALARGADYVFVLNNDTVVEPECLAKLVALMERDKNIGIVSPLHYYYGSDKVINYAGGIIHWWSGHHGAVGTGQVDQGQYGVEPRDTGFASGAAMLIRCEALKRNGLLDAKLFLLYEDLDISVRVGRAGYRIVIHPKAIIWHKESRSFKFQRGRMSPLRAYYSGKNQIVFRRRYSSTLQWLVYNLWLWGYRAPVHSLYFLLTTRSPKVTINFFKGIFEGYRGI